MVTLYKNAINKLHSKEIFKIEPGLDRISLVLNHYKNPQNDLKYIHVAGTNGKGSVCAILESILREAGYKTGLYTSPHIFDYTERIKISGTNISEKDFARYFEKVIHTVKELNTYLTEFEILTVIMFLYFKENGVDIVVLETGLGGRFDATNVIEKNICSIITRIDLDHTNILGNTKEKIASEKAGIIKTNCPVITLNEYDEISSNAFEKNSRIIPVIKKIKKDYFTALNLKGLHQRENLALALTAIINLFDISYKTIIQGLEKVKHPFRFEYFKDKNLIIDVSHNPNGISALRENLDFYFPNCERRFVFGCLNTKDYAKMMKILFRKEDEIYLNEFDYPNSMTYEELSKVCPFKSKKYSNQIKLSPDKLNIICGSFYMLKELLNENLINTFTL